MPDETRPEPAAHAWQLVQHVYFPTAVYTVIRPDFLAPVRAVFDEYIAAAKLKTAIDPVHPQVMSDNFSNDARVAGFAHHVANAAWNILKDQGYSMQGRATFFSEMWGQEHGKTSSMAEHVHPGAQIVGFYFLETPPGSSKIQLHDPRPGKAMAHLPAEPSAKSTMAHTVVTLTPEPGMLFFANAWLPHSLTRHGADVPLSVVHFNLGVQKVPAKLMPPAAGNAIVI